MAMCNMRHRSFFLMIFTMDKYLHSDWWQALNNFCFAHQDKNLNLVTLIIQLESAAGVGTFLCRFDDKQILSRSVYSWLRAWSNSTTRFSRRTKRFRATRPSWYLKIYAVVCEWERETSIGALSLSARMLEYQQQISSLEGDCRDLRSQLQVGGATSANQMWKHQRVNLHFLQLVYQYYPHHHIMLNLYKNVGSLFYCHGQWWLVKGLITHNPLWLPSGSQQILPP